MRESRLILVNGVYGAPEHFDALRAALAPDCATEVFTFRRLGEPDRGKLVTWTLLLRRIKGNARGSNPVGLWRSLNWISVPQVKRIARSDRTLEARFDRRTLAWMMERALSDDQFASRRSRWMVSAIAMLRSLGLLHLASFVPATCQPIMDVRLTKKG